MQPEFIQIESELTELWWRVPLALSAVIGCLWLFGLAIGSISSSSSRDPKSTAQSEAYGILRTIWCHIAHRKFHRDTGVKFADCCKTQCTRCDVVFLGAIKTISKFSAKDHPNKKTSMNWLYFAFGMVAGVLCSVAGAVWLAFAGTATQNQITKEMSQQRKQQSGK